MAAIDEAGPWVSVVFIQDIDQEDFDFDGADIDDIIQHLMQWDQGEDTDAVHIYDEAPWGTHDRLAQCGEYVLASDFRRGTVSLNRRPITA